MRELDLSIEKRVEELLGEVRVKSRLEVDDELNLKLAERDETISGLKRQIEVLRKKA